LDPPAVEVSGLHYAVGEAGILHDVNAAAPRAKVSVIVGPSGAGKSTLLRCVNRLAEPTAGEVYLDGEPTSAMDPIRLRRRVGMVFQVPAFAERTVRDAVLYGARLSGQDADADALLTSVGLDPALMGRDPTSLSVGEQQRAAVARALALRPEVLLMDEPTSALDGVARDRIEDLVRDLNRRRGLTILMVSHDLDQVARLADHVIVLVDGRCEGCWTGGDFFSLRGEKTRASIEGRT
jgi:putative ABC transport system ATP-binding protein